MSIHGGDVWRVAWELGIQPAELLDFSANINPRGLPPGAGKRLARDASDRGLLGAYPDPSARALRNTLSEKFQVPADAITVGPGAESLLAPILRQLQPRRALVPIPAFSEYKRICVQQAIEYVPFALSRSACFHLSVDCFCRNIQTESCDVVFLNNPHNPSGAMLHPEEVRRILHAAAYSNATLLLDEAFIDYVPQASIVRDAVGAPRLIVLRSLTKFYGCPGLRVGYAVSHPETARRIHSLLPTWPVTQLALDALTEAIADREYAETSLRENANERELLASALTDLGVSIFPSAANYLLMELGPEMPRAPELRDRLLRKHRILIRNCDSYEGLAPGRYVRMAVRSRDENRRLVLALAQELTR